MGFNPIHMWNVVKVGASCAGARSVDWGSREGEREETNKERGKEKRVKSARV